jgi:predicted nucleic acid-binding protein
LALAPLHSFLRSHRRIALDTSVFIYQIESNPTYVALTDEIFAWLERPDRTAVTSTITMTEFLVQPYREGRDQLVDKFYGFLGTYPNLDWIPPSLAIADAASKIRARHRLATIDALQAATAVHAGATGLITNDPAFSRVPDFETFLLDDAVRS